MRRVRIAELVEHGRMLLLVASLYVGEGAIAMYKQVVLAFLIAGGLSGCWGHTGVHLVPSEFDIPRCHRAEPMALTDLPTGRTPCDLEGTPMVFPDGMTVEAPEIGGRARYGEFYAATSSVSDTYSITNLGVYGIVAAQTSPDHKHTRWWGSSEGIKKEQEAFGMNDGN